jgi:c-di-GMP-specific phosphodiesterase
MPQQRDDPADQEPGAEGPVLVGRHGGAQVVAQQDVDPVTGLLRYDAGEAAALAPATAAVLVVEVDDYLMTSQVIGDEAGKVLLMEAASRVRRAAREIGGQVRRLEGPHLLVLVPAGQEGAIGDAASHLALVHDRPAAHDAGALTVGIAVGPRDGHDVPSLIRAAMVAVARGKQDQPGSAVFYEPRMAEEARERFALGRALRAAIDRRDIDLAFQPQLHLATGAVVGVEVLARWTDGPRGPVPPASFVRIADQLGMGRALDRLVFEKTAEQLRAWDEAGVVVPRISVNLSPDTLRVGRLPDAAAEIIRRSGTTPDRYTVEIIESRVLEAEAGLRTLRRLREAGVRVSLDDFGTGYASFSQLVALPVDELKIDRAFLAQTEAGGADASSAVIGAIVGLAHTLDLDVVAEGVETPEQHDLLRAMGCPAGQGYLYSRPLSAEGLAAWLTTWQARPVLPGPRVGELRTPAPPTGRASPGSR